MYDILIADDEELLREGLEARLKSRDWQVGTIRQAADGESAWRMILDEAPDIAFIDVRMPGLDGLELIERVHGERPSVRCVIVTGHADFAYAQRAIRAGASSYLLKPIADAEFSAALAQAMREVDERRGAQEAIGRSGELERRLRLADLGLALGQFLLGGAGGDLPQALGEELFGAWAGCRYMVAIVSPGGGGSGGEAQAKEIVESLECRCRMLAFESPMGRDEVVVLLGHAETNELLLSSSQFLRRVHEALRAAGRSRPHIALSGVGDRVGPELYNQALEALDLRFRDPDSSIHRYAGQSGANGCAHDLNREFARDFAMPHDTFRRLQSFFERRDLTAIESALRELFSPASLKGMPSIAPRVYWNGVVNALVEAAVVLGSAAESFPRGELLDGTAFERCDGSDEIVARLYQAALTTLSPQGVPELSSANRIRMAAQYIEQHFAEDITVNDLAERYAMNPSYFSTSFRKEMGSTVIAYLTDTRIRRAKSLLAGTTMSILDISQTIGYQDHQYFFRVFKRVAGVTPLEYRRVSSKE